MNGPTLSSADEILAWLSRELLLNGRSVHPRGRRTLELAPCTFTLSNPRARRIANPHRRWNEALAVGELAWHLAGSDDLNAIAYYAKAWRGFSDDGRTIHGSCYGRKIFGGAPGASQWDRVSAELRRDPNSRRALIAIADPRDDLRASSKDVPCLTALQFLIRDGLLQAVAFMRSNDLVWGLCYDLYLLTTLQELMASELGVPPGTYTHVATSMHAYEQHWEMLERIAGSSPGKIASPILPLAHPEQKDEFVRLERSLRVGGEVTGEGLDPFWRELARPLFRLSERRGALSRTMPPHEVTA